MILNDPDKFDTENPEPDNDTSQETLWSLSDDEIARQMRSRRRQLQILRRMIAEREGRSNER